MSAPSSPQGFEEIRVGGNFRRYTPNSDGTIFSDTAGVVITNQEYGLYAGARKRFAEDKVITTATIRADKNQNFDWVFSPAASLVWQPREQDYFRVSFSERFAQSRHWQTNTCIWMWDQPRWWAT